MASSVVLIAGIPGAGKSTFCEHLTLDKGWLHLDIDWLDRSKPWPNEKLRQAWNVAIQTGDPATFIRACKKFGNVIIDWGFPIQQMFFVHKLAAHGVKIFWFDADVQAARRVFANRATVLPSAFDQQMTALNSVNVPGAIGAKVIRVLEKGPRFKPYDQILKEIRAFGE